MIHFIVRFWNIDEISEDTDGDNIKELIPTLIHSYSAVAGTLTVHGPRNQDLVCMLGMQCTFNLIGFNKINI